MLSSAFPSTGLLTFITPHNLCQSAPLPARVSGTIYLAFICAQPIFHWTTRMRPVYGCRGILTLSESVNWQYHNGIVALMEFQVNTDAVLVKVHFNRTQPQLPKAQPEGGNIMRKLGVLILWLNLIHLINSTDIFSVQCALSLQPMKGYSSLFVLHFSAGSYISINATNNICNSVFALGILGVSASKQSRQINKRLTV